MRSSSRAENLQCSQQNFHEQRTLHLRDKAWLRLFLLGPLDDPAARQVLCFEFSALENAFAIRSASLRPVETRLRALRQRNREFAQYLPTWLDSNADCQYDDEALKSFSQMGVSDGLKSLSPWSLKRMTFPHLVYRCQPWTSELRGANASIYLIFLV